MADNTVSEFSYHEAMDRLFIVQDMANDCLVEHPAIIAEPEVLAIVEEALAKMADAYQAMAKIRFDKFPDVEA